LHCPCGLRVMIGRCQRLDPSSSLGGDTPVIFFAIFCEKTTEPPSTVSQVGPGNETAVHSRPPIFFGEIKHFRAGLSSFSGRRAAVLRYLRTRSYAPKCALSNAPIFSAGRRVSTALQRFEQLTRVVTIFCSVTPPEVGQHSHSRTPTTAFRLRGAYFTATVLRDYHAAFHCANRRRRGGRTRRAVGRV
jgi:hypothetical protein